MSVERRINPRLRLRRKLVLSNTSSGDSIISVWSYDISSGGLQLHMEDPLPVGTQFDLRLPIPDEHESSGFHYIDVHTRVVHVVLESSSGYYRLGVEFVEFHADGKSRFEDYWESLLRQQLTRQPLR